MFYDDRPKIEIEKSVQDKLLQITPFILLGIGLVYTLINYNSLPAQVPVHFNFSGEVTNYAEKNSIWFLTILGFVLTFGMYKLMQYPHQFNYPVKITPENAEKQYKSAIKMMTYMNIGVASLFLIINYEIVRVSINSESGFSLISHYVLNGILLAMVVVPIIQVVLTIRKQKN
ncbi:DUF1648 domain-containing protein [Corallibacter sp.]|uniref:DUF1648 domain-containing protein n=1 Tax=Corallibacter sp. TaxID=2038084 RepID=UPI003A934DD6